MEIAYPEVPVEVRRTMAVDTFSSTIGNGYLQRHLLAVETPSLEAAVRAGNEYLQIQPGNRTGERQRVTTFNDEREEQEEEIQRTEQVSTPVTDPIVKMTEALVALSNKIDKLGPREPEPLQGRNMEMAKQGTRLGLERYRHSEGTCQVQAQKSVANSEGKYACATRCYQPPCPL